MLHLKDTIHRRGFLGSLATTAVGVAALNLPMHINRSLTRRARMAAYRLPGPACFLCPTSKSVYLKKMRLQFSYSAMKQFRLQ